MKKIHLTKLFIGIGLLSTIFLFGCASEEVEDIPTVSISSVLDVLKDDTSGITWYNQTQVKLGPTITFTGEGVTTNGSNMTITKGGNYILSGTLSNGSITVDTTEPVNLTLANVNITNLSGPAIHILNSSKAYITLLSDTTNYLMDGTTYDNTELNGTLMSHVPLFLQGNGTLDITAQYKHAIACDASLTIANGNLVLSALQDGLYSGELLTINGGNINIDHAINGVSSKQHIHLTEGTLSIANATNGMVSRQDITIDGGTLNITDCSSGIISDADIQISDGNFNILTNAHAIEAKKALTISNGHLHLSSTTSALYANHSVTIGGGVILALTSSLEEPGISSGDLLAINGGTLLATGNPVGMADMQKGSQYAIILDHIHANTLVHIESSASSILTFAPTEDYPYLLFSSPQLVKDKTYDLYEGGTVSGGTDFYGLYTNETYTGGVKRYTFACNKLLSEINELLPQTSDLPTFPKEAPMYKSNH